MAGATAMGDLSQAHETLLAGMASGRIAPAPDALGLIQRCLDRLHQMRDGLDAGKAVAVSGELLHGLEQFAAGRVSAEQIERTLAGADAAPPSEPSKSGAPQAAQAAAKRDAATARADVPKTDAADTGAAQRTAAQIAAGQTAAAQTAAAQAAAAPTPATSGRAASSALATPPPSESAAVAPPMRAPPFSVWSSRGSSTRPPEEGAPDCRA
jgi:chemotaxis protein histidine kinase CheA